MLQYAAGMPRQPATMLIAAALPAVACYSTSAVLPSGGVWCSGWATRRGETVMWEKPVACVLQEGGGGGGHAALLTHGASDATRSPDAHTLHTARGTMHTLHTARGRGPGPPTDMTPGVTTPILQP